MSRGHSTIPGGWDERLLICMHNVVEDLDFHSCNKCQRIAKDIGLEVKTTGPMVNRITYLFESQEHVDDVKKYLKEIKDKK